MSATQDRNTPFKDGELVPVPVAAGARIYAGTMVVVNAAGYAVPGSTATGLAYLGRADDGVDNSAGAAGAAVVLVRRGKVFKYGNAAADPVTQASFGRLAYIVDDQTVAASNGEGTRSAAGIVLGIDADGVWIQ